MPQDAQDRINDFVIKLANVNGTGSASANTLLMKSIFRMGIPVIGKNYFPSNIQGLPTWYEIRVTRDAYVARSGRVDFMVAMNAETYAKDIKEVSPGGYLIYDSTWPRPALLKRDDITLIGVPLAVAVSMLMASVFVDLGGFDPIVVSVATVVLGIAATIATVIPSRRAARIEPLRALRAE